MRALFVTSIVRQGVFGRQRWSYWKFLLTVATRYRHCVGTGHDPGGDGLSLSGHDQKVVRQRKLADGGGEFFFPSDANGRLLIYCEDFCSGTAVCFSTFESSRVCDGLRSDRLTGMALIAILILVLIGALPIGPHRGNRGYDLEALTVPRTPAKGRRILLFRAAALVLIVLGWCGSLFAYSVLTHEEIVDLMWTEEIRPLLLQRFPGLSDDQIREAHAYAYGGSVIQDLGYYPFGNKEFSNLAHYVRSGDFVCELMP